MNHTTVGLVTLGVSLVLAIPYASILEWTIHRFMMHRPLGRFRYPFEAHALTHHRVFKHDETYHLQKEADRHTIPMAWWNGPALVASGTLPIFLLCLLFGGWRVSLWASLGTVIVASIYYGVYERIHWCMHLPKARRMEKSWLFWKLNGHHLLHHRYMHQNFNVVLPFADFIFRTLLLRAKTHFKQATGPSVPNVQPLRRNRSAFTASPASL